MRYRLKKIKVLWGLLLSTYEAWREDLWDRDLYENYCCDGRECACEGATVEEMWFDAHKPKEH